MPLAEGQPLRILHATRAPVGGIIRHILDLANGQADRGHHVGIIADSLTGGERANAALAEIAPRMKLGVYRVAIRREPSLLDFATWVRFMTMVRRLKPDVLHGHGAKAGAFLATLISFFLVEVGDKTQIATVALAARFDGILLVTAGTTLGMMLVNVPAVLCGNGIARRLPLKPIRIAAAALFAILGALTLLRWDFGLLGA